MLALNPMQVAAQHVKLHRRCSYVEDRRSAGDCSWPVAAEALCPCKHAEQEWSGAPSTVQGCRHEGTSACLPQLRSLPLTAVGRARQATGGGCPRGLQTGRDGHHQGTQTTDWSDGPGLKPKTGTTAQDPPTTCLQFAKGDS